MSALSTSTPTGRSARWSQRAGSSAARRGRGQRIGNLVFMPGRQGSGTNGAIRSYGNDPARRGWSDAAMPLARYFLFVGGALLALLFVVDAGLPKFPVPDRADSDSPVIRIHTDRKWPESVVFNTSLP